MGVTNKFSGQLDAAGASAYTTLSRETDLQEGGQTSVPAAQAGTLSTRTDNDTGVVTFASAHGLSPADVIDVYWSGGMRFNMKVSASDTLTITIGTNAGDVGAGDNLPAQATAVTVCKVKSLPVSLNGDLVKILQMHSDKRGHVTFLTSVPAVIYHRELVANESHTWAKPPSDHSPTEGDTNPLAGQTVATIGVSNASTTAAAKVTVGLGYDPA